ncbi:N-acetyl-gamma-glutamyl-phosphate reductase [Brachybacterium sp. EF45031]|uniref:N-acetyl-gamma-glutamyl-phosphate reductase n=1 Tax=Brachybacterium sillae TaxID=2810536 RepID=UPI00217DFFCC|nr:N-acetyl-gamma-glutamyl-phosphate reductase [Brachybacterium sillae]MCS6711105.1 N-acetyl-gamma-glutamyl-phosphate reductase [Brachybacterium sillae]
MTVTPAQTTAVATPAAVVSPDAQPASALRVALVGASGYAGGETLRLLLQHPSLHVTTLTGNSSAGRRLSEIAPHLVPDEDLEVQPTTIGALRGHDVVVLALPHGHSGAVAAQLEESGDDAIVVDLAADHRLERAEDWREYYGSEHAGTWTYAMPELPLAGGGHQRDLLAGARRLAVPGCNATAVTLALVPLVAAGLADPRTLQAVLPVGYSGAGRSPKQNLLLSEGASGAVPYGVGGTHRHIPEILQNLRRATGIDGALLTFTPVLVPMVRGILAVCTAEVPTGVTTAQVLEALTVAYASEPFVQVLPEGRMPSTADVLGSNTVRLGAAVDRRSGHLTVLCAIDNLVKGTAGAAVQSLNLALGLPETLGLPRSGLRP